MYRFWTTKIFQTSILFEINKFHHGGPPWSGGPEAIAPPLIRPWEPGSFLPPKFSKICLVAKYNNKL